VIIITLCDLSCSRYVLSGCYLKQGRPQYCCCCCRCYSDSSECGEQTGT